MINKPSYEELEAQIAALKMENENLLTESPKTIGINLSNLSESKYQVNSILNFMGDAVFIKDDHSRLILVNDSFCELFKKTRFEILGKTLANDVPLKEREQFLKGDKEVINNGIDKTIIEPLTIDNSTKYIISSRKSRFIDSEGKKFIIGVIRDITEQNQAEQVIKENEIKYRNLNTTKDTLLSIIGHDLRSPIANILSLTELIKLNVEHDNKTDSLECINLVERSVQNSLNLLNNLLDWAKSQTGQLEVNVALHNLDNIIDSVFKQLQSNAHTKNIALISNLADFAEINTDKRILSTVLRNLTSNAIKFTNENGTVEIHANSNKDHIELCVSDNGVGIPESIKENMFNITKNSSTAGTENEGGSGFGLILCKEFIELLDGTIWVESEVGKGSDFKISLPIPHSV